MESQKRSEFEELKSVRTLSRLLKVASFSYCPYMVSCIFPFLDCSRVLICLFMYFSEINGEGKPSVAICDGSSKYID